MTGGLSTMRTGVAPSETVVPSSPGCQEPTRAKLNNQSGPAEGASRSAQQGLADLLGGLDRQRSELQETGDRHPAHRAPDAEHTQRAFVEVEDRRRDAVQRGLELTGALGVPALTDVV